MDPMLVLVIAMLPAAFLNGVLQALLGRSIKIQSPTGRRIVKGVISGITTGVIILAAFSLVSLTAGMNGTRVYFMCAGIALLNFLSELSPPTFKLRSSRLTMEVTEKLPEGAQELPMVDLDPSPQRSNLLIGVIASICLCFMVTRLDAVSSAPGVRSFVIALLNWGSLYWPFFPEHFWAPVTCMWFHGGVMHIVSNMLGMAICCWLLRKAYRGNWWLLIFLVGGAIGNLGHLVFYPVPIADFTNWHGSSLDSIFMQDTTPLAGASGGVFALWGAVVAAALRYAVLHKSGVLNRMGIGVVAMLLPAVFQFMFIDTTITGIAGLAHELGLLAGFVLGMLPTIEGNVSVLASRPDIAGLRSVIIDNKDRQLLGVHFYLKSGFSAATDFVLLAQDSYDWRNRRMSNHQLLAGTDSGSSEVPRHVLADCKNVLGCQIQLVEAVEDQETANPGKQAGTATAVA